MKQPRVSVVMPVYNAAPFLRQAVDSVLAQTMGEFEFLIFDDGSTDASISMLEKFSRRDSRIRVHLRSHAGYTPHLNEGVQIALGEFIARMDADDISHPERFSKQLDYLQNNAEVVAVGSSVGLMDEWGDLFSVRKVPQNHEGITKALLNGEGGVIPHPSAMIRTRDLRLVDGYREEFEPAEDFDLWLRLGERGKLANIDQILLSYRTYSGMTSALKTTKQVNAVNTALKEAWSRRNLDGLVPSVPVRELPRKSKADFFASRMNKALGNGFHRTARRYATRIVARRFWSVQSWRQLFKCGYAEIRERRSTVNGPHSVIEN